MKKSNVLIVILALVILCGAVSVALVLTFKGYDEITRKPYFVGTWTEDSTGVKVTLTENNVFRVLDNDAATYEYEEANDNEGTLTLSYAKTYGGKVITMQYTANDTKLTLTQEATGEVQTYTRISTDETK